MSMFCFFFVKVTLLRVQRSYEVLFLSESLKDNYLAAVEGSTGEEVVFCFLSLNSQKTNKQCTH